MNKNSLVYIVMLSAYYCYCRLLGSNIPTHGPYVFLFFRDRPIRPVSFHFTSCPCSLAPAAAPLPLSLCPSSSAHSRPFVPLPNFQSPLPSSRSVQCSRTWSAINPGHATKVDSAMGNTKEGHARREGGFGDGELKGGKVTEAVEEV